MAEAQGFRYVERADGSVVIRHHGRAAVTLRGGRPRGSSPRSTTTRNW
ncbi:hypothetical protein [Micromonospora sp. NPDC005367]